MVGKNDGMKCSKPCKTTKKTNKLCINDKRAADAQKMHRGDLIKWAIKQYPNKKRTPLRKMRKANLIKMYTKGGKS